MMWVAVLQAVNMQYGSNNNKRDRVSAKICRIKFVTAKSQTVKSKFL